MSLAESLALSGYQPSLEGLSVHSGLQLVSLFPSPSGYSGDLWVQSAQHRLSSALFQGILQYHGTHSGHGGLASQGLCQGGCRPGLGKHVNPFVQIESSMP